MLVDRSNTDTPELARPPRGEERALPRVAGAESRFGHARNERGSASSRISGLLVVLFLVASLFALYEVARTPRAFTNDAHTSDSVHAIRNFYAALDEFMETGDASAVSNTVAPGALAFVPEQGAMGADSSLLTYLLALRSTCPQLRFTVEQIGGGGDIAIARVRRSAAPDGSALGAPAAGGISQEFFRVQDGRIVQHWTMAPSSVLLHPLTVSPMPVTISQPGHLAIAELIFSPGNDNVEPIEGPALVIVQQGHLTLAEDGLSQILDLATGATSIPETHGRAAVRPGQAIAIPDGLASVWNDDSERATALIATLAENPPPPMEYLPFDLHPPAPPINDASLLRTEHASVNGAATVRPLVFADRSTPSGKWELEFAWAVLGPGASLPPEADEWGVAHVISGSANGLPIGQHDAGISNTLTNDADIPLVALMIRLRATH